MNLDYKEFTEEDKLNSFLFLQDYILNKNEPFFIYKCHIYIASHRPRK